MRFGVKAAPTDARRAVEVAETALAEAGLLNGPVVAETVLFGRDVEAVNLDATVDAFASLDEVIVHAPFTTPAGPDVDVAAADRDAREAALATWRATLDLADRLGARWTIVHAGGIRSPSQVRQGGAHRERADALEHMEAALRTLQETGHKERVLLENMPTEGHHGHDGSEAVFLTGTSAIDLASWRDLVAGFVLDTSHAVMTPGGAENLKVILDRVGGSIRHVHIADGRAPRDEGLQIGEGVVPWADTLERLHGIEETHDRVLTVVPEIRAGHQDDHAGFREAYARLGRLIAA